MKLHLGKHQKIKFRGRLLQDYTHAGIELTVPVGSEVQTDCGFFLAILRIWISFSHRVDQSEKLRIGFDHLQVKGARAFEEPIEA